MFNFKELKLDKREDAGNLSSFVGIRRNNNELEFRLPKGFNSFPDQDFDATKKLFFKMYRTFKKFERDNKSLSLDEKSAGKDNIEAKGNAYAFKDKEDNEVLLYSKIAVIENLLEAYQDLALDIIERRIGRNEEINFSKIDQYLHNAIYLPNDVIYLDEMDLPRQTLHYDSATIIDLFCFILSELENELEQDTDNRVEELANRFKEQHLSHDQSLFNEETFEVTIIVLKDVLDDIDKQTAYKDDDYWRLYEAIEAFLYGELDMQNTHEDGIFWGISNFYQIWEDMCNTYAFASSDFKVVYADTNIIFNGKTVANDRTTGCAIFKNQDFENPFFIEFRNQKRWIRPDCIYLLSNDEDGNKIFDSILNIITKKDYGITLDFEVKLIDKRFELIYLFFLEKLRKNLGGARAIAKNSFNHYRKSELEKSKKNLEERHKRLQEQSTVKLDICVLLDWKYMNTSCFLNFNKKINQDITKQLCYESSLKQCRFESEIESLFVIPFFYDNIEELLLEDKIGDFVDEDLLYSRLRENKIKVHKCNFSKIQEVYLNHD